MDRLDKLIAAMLTALVVIAIVNGYFALRETARNTRDIADDLFSIRQAVIRAYEKGADYATPSSASD